MSYQRELMGMLRSKFNVAKLTLWELAQQTPKLQSEMMSVTNVVINILC